LARNIEFTRANALGKHNYDLKGRVTSIIYNIVIILKTALVDISSNQDNSWHQIIYIHTLEICIAHLLVVQGLS
jgi:hypothetical protein